MPSSQSQFSDSDEDVLVIDTQKDDYAILSTPCPVSDNSLQIPETQHSTSTALECTSNVHANNNQPVEVNSSPPI